MKRLKYLFSVPQGEKVTEKHLRRVLLSSVCSILLCLTCLVSTTWAWFTTTLTNTGNEIEVGSFNIEVDVRSMADETQPVTATDGVYALSRGEYRVKVTHSGTSNGRSRIAFTNSASVSLGTCVTEALSSPVALAGAQESSGNVFEFFVYISVDSVSMTVSRFWGISEETEVSDGKLVVVSNEELQVKESEYTVSQQVFESVRDHFPDSAISSGNSVSFTSPPYAYTVSKDVFSGQKITKIGIPVQSVKAVDENQTFTLSVVDTASQSYTVIAQYVLKLPVDQLNSTTVNKWIDVDVSDLNIYVEEGQTLAFGGENDAVTWAWKSGYGDNTYYFRNVNEDWNKSSGGIFFDVHTEKNIRYAEYLEVLRQEQERIEAEQKQKEQEQQLKTILTGKKLSILGDSISTFEGYSNNTSYNSTIGGNAVWYFGTNNGFTDVNETWWMQAISRTGTTLLVNNSWSGDMVTNHGVGRALELDNNEGTNPDLIAVYLGINDFRTKVTAETFAQKYDEIIQGMTQKYTAAQVYLFTLVYTTDVSSGVAPADVVYFNEIIKDVATKYGCTVVDLYNDSGITPETMAANMADGDLHPNYNGMDKITDCFIRTLIKQYVTETP